MKQRFRIKLLFAVFIILIGIFCGPVLVSASSQIPMQGTASVVNTGGSLDFDHYNSNVTVDSATGDISGYVWSQDLGWVDFDNNGGSGGAYVDLDSGSIIGLAYVVNTGGLIDFTNYNSSVVVNLASGDITGYAWSEDVGWIDFSNVLLADSLSSLTGTGQNILPLFLTAIPTVIVSILFMLRKRMIKAD